MSAQYVAREIIAGRLLASPVAERLGLSVDEVASGRLRLRMPFDLSNVTEGTMVHGGVIATLADVAAVAAAASSARLPPNAGATSHLALSYLSPANGCDLVAIATTIRAGSRQNVVRVEVQDPSALRIAEALVTVFLA